MSRWSERYKQFIDSNEWTAICEHVENLKIGQLANSEVKIEALKFKKIASSLSNFLNATDPEIVPLNTWDDMDEYVRKCHTTLGFHLESPDPNSASHKSANDGLDYKSANDALDELFTTIRPFITSDKAAAQQAGMAFRSYADDVEEAIQDLSKHSDDALTKITQKAEDAKSLYSRIATYSQKIFGQETENGDSGTGLQGKLEKLHSEFEKCHGQIIDFRKNLLESQDSTDENNVRDSIKVQIEKTVKTIEEHEKNAAGHLESIEVQKTNLEEFHKIIFGSENGHSEEENDQLKHELPHGLKNELEQQFEKLKNFQEDQEKVHTTLKEQIESLLPGATSAGLANSYQQRKESARKNVELYTKRFWCAILFLLLLSTVGVVGLPTVEHLVLHAPIEKLYDPERWVIRLMWTAPLAGPLFWWAGFCSNRRSENNQLEEEYAHKEALAKSYESYKRQIDDLQVQRDELLVKLMETAIEAIGRNPAETLNKPKTDNKLFPQVETQND